ncbi:Uncharacterised protein [uncultured archaeon]|nr:Uncharacterised protein [uncultured archaeon]
MVSGFVPVKMDITRKTPSRIYFGDGQKVTYVQYQSSVASARGNELWIQKGADWSQYAIVPEGTGVPLIAFSSTGGQADYYELLQTDNQNIIGKRMDLYSGYTSLSFPADKVGRHILLFVLNNQPSNAIIIDVISQAPPSDQNAGQMPSAIPSQQTSYTSSKTTTTSTAYPGYATTYAPQTGAAVGDTSVTIQTTMRGYDVYVDGIMVGKEGTNGDIPDGIFKFTVVGGQTHTIRIFDGVNNYEKPMYFERRVSKIINVPAATTVYTTGEKRGFF